MAALPQDQIAREHPPRIDDIASTPAEHASLATLRDLVGKPDSTMERHVLRQYLIAEKIADVRGLTVDHEVLLCASLLHDAGLFVPERASRVYITDSAILAKRVLEPFDWPAQRLKTCLDAISQHHAPRSREHMGVEVELVRASDLVEVSGGHIRSGVPRTWLKELFAAVPRTGFYRMLASVVPHELAINLPGRRSSGLQ